MTPPILAGLPPLDLPEWVARVQERRQTVPTVIDLRLRLAPYSRTPARSASPVAARRSSTPPPRGVGKHASGRPLRHQGGTAARVRALWSPAVEVEGARLPTRRTTRVRAIPRRPDFWRPVDALGEMQVQGLGVVVLGGGALATVGLALVVQRLLVAVLGGAV